MFHPGPEQAHVIGNRQGNWAQGEHIDRKGQHDRTDETFSYRMT